MLQYLRPSDFFIEDANNSVFKEDCIKAGEIMKNILSILSKKGNVWRNLSQVEYENERENELISQKRGVYPQELEWFKKVSPFTSSAEECSKFSPTFKELYNINK